MTAIFLVAIISSKIYQVYQNNKLGESVFARMGGNIQYTDIENAISELPTDGFIFISYTKSSDIKKLENNLKKIVVANELQNNFYYLDATELMLENDYVNTLNKKFALDDDNMISDIPAILYYKDGKLKKTIDSSNDRMLNSDDFNKLLDSYEIIQN